MLVYCKCCLMTATEHKDCRLVQLRGYEIPERGCLHGSVDEASAFGSGHDFRVLGLSFSKQKACFSLSCLCSQSLALSFSLSNK